MIYADLKGNLGNQMFIYACARKIQEETGQKIQLNTYYLEKRYKDYKCSLNIFELNDDVEISNKKVFPFYASTSSIFFRILKRLCFNKKKFEKIYYKFFGRFNAFVNDGDEFWEIDYREDRDIFLSGFFQSERYFENMCSILNKEFDVKNKNLSEHNRLFLDKIMDSNSVCVSVRRGDYISNPIFNKKHFVCDDEYFKRSFELIKEYVHNPTLVFFSDDPEWVKDNYRTDIQAIYEKKDNSLEEKIIMMRSCKHFVLSNSTFSWWVEYLCEYPQKTVLAPNIWYADGRETSIFQNYWKFVDIKR